MMKFWIFIIVLVMGNLAQAESLVAARTIRAQHVIEPADIALVDRAIPGALASVQAAIGMEALVILYPGRPIMAGDIAPPAMVERNQIVPIVFTRGGLTITAEARALSRGAVGDLVRVMNMSSRSTISGVVHADGFVEVGGAFR